MKRSKPEDPLAQCLACEMMKPLSQFRIARDSPLRYMDFCQACEQQHGTQHLYVKHRVDVSPDVFDMVMYAASIPMAERTVFQKHLLIAPVREPAPVISKQADVDQTLRAELASRELARRNLIHFIRRFESGYLVGWMHTDICERLVQFVKDCEAGKSPRVMLCMPPRHGKSTIGSKYFPAYVFGLHPEWEIIATSYGVTLPNKFSREIRDTIDSEAYRAIFPGTELKSDSRAVEEWRTTQRGTYTAAGVGTGITGKGAMIAIVDDPFKDRAEAQSETIRNTVWGWYTTVLRTRLAPGGGILIINTRWHDDDLSGRQEALQKEAAEAGATHGDFDKFEIISYPAIAEHDEYLFPDGSIQLQPEVIPEGSRLLRKAGEPLHEARYDLQELTRLKAVMAPGDWNALYQQNPVPDDGEYFKRGDILLMNPIKSDWLKLNNVILVGDLALGEKQQNDWSVLGVLAITVENKLQMIDFVRGRWGTLELITRIVGLVKQYSPDKLGLEWTHQTMVLMPFLKTALQKAKLHVSISEDLVPLRDKMARARPLQGRTQLRQFGLTAGAKYNDVVINEMLRFPNGRHDDIVDMLAWAQFLAQQVGPPRGAAKKKSTSWVEEFKAPKPSKSFMAA